MLISPLSIPTALAGRIKSTLRPVVDEFELKTLAQVRQLCRKSGGFALQLEAEVRIHRQKNGAIKAMKVNILQGLDPHERGKLGYVRPDRFNCLIDLHKGMSSALPTFCAGLFDYMVHEEVERRFCSGFRELMAIPDDQLKALGQETDAKGLWRGHTDAVSIEEALLHSVVVREIDARKTDSGHSRMAGLMAARQKLEAARIAIREEIEMASVENSRGVYSRFQMHASITDEEACALDYRHKEFMRALRKC